MPTFLIFQLAKKKHFENINPYVQDNKILLNMNKYKEKYLDNPELLKKDSDKLFNLLKNIPMEVKYFIKQLL